MARKPAASVALDNTSPSYGDTIKLYVTANVKSLVHVTCVNDGGLVLSAGGTAHGAGSYIEEATLASPSYTGGPASCEATVKTWGEGANLRLKDIASIAFEVSG